MFPCEYITRETDLEELVLTPRFKGYFRQSKSYLGGTPQFVREC